MAISFGDSLELQSGTKPNFTRDLYNTLEELVAVKKTRLPQMYLAFCVETGKAYLYNKSNTVDPVLGLWREVGSFDEKELKDYIKKEDLETLSYNNLKDKPTIPEKLSDLVDDSVFVKEDEVYSKEEIDNKTTFTTKTGTTVEVGNIAVGTTFNKATLSEVMTLMLYGATATPAPTMAGSSTIDYATNTVTIPFSTSAYFKTEISDESKITVSAGTLESKSFSNGKLILKFSSLSSCIITIAAGALTNTTLNDKVYTGSKENNNITASITVNKKILPIPTISTNYIASSKTINITVNATYANSYATLSTLSASSISGIDGTLSGSGKNYVFTISDNVAPGNYTVTIAENAVVLSAEEGYYAAASNGTASVSLEIEIKEETTNNYAWTVDFYIDNDTGLYINLPKFVEEYNAAGNNEDAVYELFDTEQYELYFLGTSAHPCEVLIPAAGTSQVIGVIPDVNANMISEKTMWELLDPKTGRTEIRNFRITTGTYNFTLKKKA